MSRKTLRNCLPLLITAALAVFILCIPTGQAGDTTGMATNPASAADSPLAVDNFQSQHPNAEVVVTRQIDLDGDGAQDSVILYCDTDPSGRKTTTNIWIATADHMASLDLAGGDSNFSFAYGDTSLDFDLNQQAVIVYLSDAQMNRVLAYRLTVAGDPGKSQTNIKVTASQVAS